MKKNHWMRGFCVFWGILLLLTFFSKSFYNYHLPVVSVSHPGSGTLTLTVQGKSEMAYASSESVYADADGVVREIFVEKGARVKRGQLLMKLQPVGPDGQAGKAGEEIRIRARKPGIITRIGVQPGMYVSYMQNTVLYEMAERSRRWVCDLFVGEDQWKYVEKDSPVAVELPSDRTVLRGKVEGVVPYQEGEKAGYLAEIAVNSGKNLAGIRVDLTIKKESAEYDSLVPASALHQDTRGYYVLVLQQDDRALGDGYVARRTSVDLLESDKKTCAVLGLSGDEFVITEAGEEVKDGSRVYTL